MWWSCTYICTENMKGVLMLPSSERGCGFKIWMACKNRSKRCSIISSTQCNIDLSQQRNQVPPDFYFYSGGVPLLVNFLFICSSAPDLCLHWRSTVSLHPPNYPNFHGTLLWFFSVTRCYPFIRLLVTHSIINWWARKQSPSSKTLSRFHLSASLQANKAASNSPLKGMSFWAFSTYQSHNCKRTTLHQNSSSKIQ